jgi:PAS domain S-box-containing protein
MAADSGLPTSLPAPFASAEGFIAAFAESSGAVVSYVDAAERVLFVTREAAEWLGRPPAEVIGKTVRELHEPDSYRFFEPHLRRALAGERVQ